MGKDAKLTTTIVEMFIVKMEEHVKTKDTVTNVNADQDSVEDFVKKVSIKKLLALVLLGLKNLFFILYIYYFRNLLNLNLYVCM